MTRAKFSQDSILLSFSTGHDDQLGGKVHLIVREVRPDGFLYFASMDEEGENANGSRLPTWGGHLWRMNQATYKWEHLLAAREALIAVAGGGKYIFSLGYFGHVL